MSEQRLDREATSWVLLDAIVLGDVPAAKKHQLSRRTIQRYRQWMRADPELAGLVEEKRSHVEVELAGIRVSFLRKAIQELEKRITSPTATIHEIAGAVKIVGELHQVSEALADERSDGEDPDAAEDAGAGSEEHPPH